MIAIRSYSRRTGLAFLSMAAGLVLMSAQTEAQTAKAPPAKSIPVTVIAGPDAKSIPIDAIASVFIPQLDRALADAKLGYRFAWKVVAGGSPSEDLAALSSGRATIGFVATARDPARFPLQFVPYAAPFTGTDLFIAARQIAEAEDAYPKMKAAWTNLGLTRIGVAAVDSYQLYTRTPLDGPQDLAGRRIAVEWQTANWLKGTGATATPLNPETVKADLDAGKLDGAILPGSEAVARKVVDSAQYETRINYGAMFVGGLAVNSKFFDGLPEAVRNLIVESGKAYSFKVAELGTVAGNNAFFTAMSRGAKIRQIAGAGRQRWADALPNIALEWAKPLDAQGLPATAVLTGYLQSVRDTSQELGRDWLK